MRGAGVGADEQVGPFEERGRLGNAQPTGPVAEIGMRCHPLGHGGVLGTADQNDSPAIVEEAGEQRLPVLGRPALRGHPRAEVDGKQRGFGSEPARVKPVALVAPGGRFRHGCESLQTAASIAFAPASRGRLAHGLGRSRGPVVAQPLADEHAVVIRRVNDNPRGSSSGIPSFSRRARRDATS